MSKGFNPGGEKGKLHREMGVPEGETIPKAALAKAASPSDPDREKRNDAIRAETMEGWHHPHAHMRHGADKGRGSGKGRAG